MAFLSIPSQRSLKRARDKATILVLGMILDQAFSGSQAVPSHRQLADHGQAFVPYSNGPFRHRDPSEASGKL